MSASPIHSAQPRRSSHIWLRAPALWAGLSIITMWLAVLFVGVFGGNIVSSTPGGTSTSVPVVITLLPFVLPATIVAARRGFRGLFEDEQPAAPQQQQQAPPEAAAERSELRTKIASRSDA